MQDVKEEISNFNFDVLFRFPRRIVGAARTN